MGGIGGKPNKLGVIGVYQHKNGHFVSTYYDKRSKSRSYLGMFRTLEDASKAIEDKRNYLNRKYEEEDRKNGKNLDEIPGTGIHVTKSGTFQVMVYDPVAQEIICVGNYRNKPVAMKMYERANREYSNDQETS